MRLILLLSYSALVLAQTGQVPLCLRDCQNSIWEDFSFILKNYTGALAAQCGENEPCNCGLAEVWPDITCCGEIGSCNAADMSVAYSIASSYCVTQQSVTPTMTDTSCPAAKATEAASYGVAEICASQATTSPYCSLYEAFISSTPIPSASAPILGTSSGGSSTSRTSSASQSSSTSPISDASSSTGLSTGAKAGIAVGAIAIFIAIGLAIFVVHRRSKKRRALSTQSRTFDEAGHSTLETGPPLVEKPELNSKQVFEVPTSEKGRRSDVAELDGAPHTFHVSTHELGSRTTSILRSSNEKAELPSSRSVTAGQDMSQASESSKAANTETPVIAAGLTRDDQQEPNITANNPPASSGQTQATNTITSNTSSEADSRAAHIAELEEEERRINEMIAEREHLQALRQRRLDVRQQLEDAKKSDSRLES